MKSKNTEGSDLFQTLIKCDGEFLIARKSNSNYWNFVNITGEDVSKQTTAKNLKEKTGLNFEARYIDEVRRGDSFLGEREERITPVYLDLNCKFKNKADIEDSTEEYKDFKWVKLTEFDEYNTSGQYKTLEHLGIVNGRVAIAVLEKGEKFLVAKRSPENSTPGKWGFVSGGIETGETPEEAAVRELREETGLKAEPVETGEFYIGEGEKGYWRLEPVLLEYREGEVDLNWELSEYKWLKPEEIIELDTLGRFKALEKLGIQE